MRIQSIEIKKLYGYLNFNLKFHEDLNFLIGINGSGKTSVLNVISWLTRAALMSLVRLDFSYIMLECIDDDGSLKTIIAEKKQGDTKISLKGLNESLLVPRFEYPSDTPLSERTMSISEMYDRYHIEKKDDPVIMALDKVGAPVYLPLDRRWESDEKGVMEPQQRSQSYRVRSIRPTGVIESVLYLAERSSREKQTSLAQLNEKLREDLVEYTFGDVILFENLTKQSKTWTVDEI